MTKTKFETYYAFCRTKNGCKFVKVKGIPIANTLNLPLFLFRREFDGKWSISEITSGLQLCEGETRKETVSNMEKIFHARTKEEILNKVQESIERFGKSPACKEEEIA